ncbi:MAG: hypothetical protein LBD46_05220 [Endomicrobium sp.]|jgi:hypothetical protein|nr:hypothetical protein [Endomicrobium sp.]
MKKIKEFFRKIYRTFDWLEVSKYILLFIGFILFLFASYLFVRDTFIKKHSHGYGYRTPTINGTFVPEDSNEAAEYPASEYQYFSVAGGYYVIEKSDEAEQAFAAKIWNEQTLSTLFCEGDICA